MASQQQRWEGAACFGTGIGAGGAVGAGLAALVLAGHLTDPSESSPFAT